MNRRRTRARRGILLTIFVAACLARQTTHAAPQSIAGGTLKIAPSSMTFPDQAMNSTSAPQILSLTNFGPDELRVTDILTSGIDFAQSNTCGTGVPAGASCEVSITFTPATTGPRLGTISIVTSDPSSPRLIPLTGIGK